MTSKLGTVLYESQEKMGFLVGESDFQNRSLFWVQQLEALSLQRRQDLVHGTNYTNSKEEG